MERPPKTGKPDEDGPPRQQPSSGFRVHAPKTPDKAKPQPPSPEERASKASDEIGGYDGPDPTRFGDWQHKGRVSDF